MAASDEAALADQRDERGGEGHEAAYPAKWAGQLTVGNMIANLRTLPADMPIHSAYHVVRADKPPLLFVKTPTVSRERVDGRTIKTGDETVPYSAVIWSHCRTPEEDVEAAPTDTRGGESALRDRISRALDEPHGLHSERIDAVIAALASPAAPGGVGEWRGIPPDDQVMPEDAWQELIERDDRTSPEEYPEMALITRDELMDFMRRCASAAPLAARPPLSGDR